MYIEPSEKGTHASQKMITFLQGFFRWILYIYWVKEIFCISLLLNEFLQSEIMQKSRSVQNITNIIAATHKSSGAVCMIVVLCPDFVVQMNIFFRLIVSSAEIYKIRVRWCLARDLFGSQIAVTTGRFELRISCIQSSYLTH